MSNNIVNRGEKLNSGNLMSPEQTLNSVISELGENGALKDCKKMIVLALDESNDEYKVSGFQAGMKMSQCVALCEVSKALFVEEMGF